MGPSENDFQLKSWEDSFWTSKTNLCSPIFFAWWQMPRKKSQRNCRNPTYGFINDTTAQQVGDLFGMAKIKWPFGKAKWPPSMGWNGQFEDWITWRTLKSCLFWNHFVVYNYWTSTINLNYCNNPEWLFLSTIIHQSSKVPQPRLLGMFLSNANQPWLKIQNIQFISIWCNLPQIPLPSRFNPSNGQTITNKFRKNWGKRKKNNLERQVSYFFRQQKTPKPSKLLP